MRTSPSAARTGTSRVTSPSSSSHWPSRASWGGERGDTAHAIHSPTRLPHIIYSQSPICKRRSSASCCLHPPTACPVPRLTPRSLTSPPPRRPKADGLAAFRLRDDASLLTSAPNTPAISVHDLRLSRDSALAHVGPPSPVPGPRCGRGGAQRRRFWLAACTMHRDVRVQVL